MGRCCVHAKNGGVMVTIFRLVALLMAIAAIVSMLRVPAGGSRTTMILALVLMAPLTIVGGRFYRRLRASTARPR